MAPHLTHRFPARPAEVGRARSLLTVWLEDIGVGGDDACDLILVFSELATNAVIAAMTPRKGAAGRDEDRAVIHLNGFYDAAAGVVLEVTGEGPRLDPRTLAMGLPVDGEKGRGLAIAASLTDLLEVERHGSSTMVRATKSVKQAGRAQR